MDKEKKTEIQIRSHWCKRCGICYSLCPKAVLDKDSLGRVIIKNPAACSQCRICEEHCPDYCIKIGG